MIIRIGHKRYRVKGLALGFLYALGIAYCVALFYAIMLLPFIL